MSHNTSVEHPILKAGTALGGAGFAQTAAALAPPPAFAVFGIPVNTMADIASLLAATYTLCLIGEWAWRKFLRPFAENRKWLKRKFRRAADQQFHDKYGV